MPSPESSKQPTSSTGPKRFLTARTIRSRGAALALELQHHVDEVLEHPRAGDAAVLGDVADHHRRDALGLRDPHQGGGDLLDLGHPAGHAVDVGRADGLHRVDDQQLGADLVDVAEHRAEVGLGGEVELVVDRRRAVGPQPHLRGGLLAGDVEHPQPGPRGLRGDLEQQRRLADPGLAGEQHGGAGHHTAAEHPVELGDAAGARRASPRRAPGRSGRAGELTGPASVRRWAAGRPRRRCPRPGTRRSGRPSVAVSQPHSEQRYDARGCAPER